MLAAIASGHADLADAMFLIAVFIFAVTALVAVIRPALNVLLILAAMSAGLACLAIAWLVL